MPEFYTKKCSPKGIHHVYEKKVLFIIVGESLVEPTSSR